MLKIGIIERIENYDSEEPFNKRYALDSYFKDIADELDIILIPIVSSKHIDEVVDLCDGLIVTGSVHDVHPSYYNEEALPDKKYEFDEYPFVRDVVKAFNNKKKPIFGICAGIQEINVIFGGSLHQKINNHSMRDGTMHTVLLDESSILYEVFGQKEVEVNSYHNQAINRLADGFKVTAISKDGTIEGIERDNIIAVQWHPEVLMDIKLFQGIINILFVNDKNKNKVKNIN